MTKCPGTDGSCEELLALAKARMPFGKYQGRLLIDLPEPYVVWFAGQGFPAGKLGQMLRTVYEIKVNGLEYLFEPLRSRREHLSSGNDREEIMKICISGGTGFVGGHLRRELLERGHRLRLLVHRRNSGIEQESEQVEGDVSSADSCMAAVEGCDAVINLVGIIREFPGRDITFERLHVQATANMLAAAAGNGIRRYLQMSALGTRPQAVAAYHKTKFRAEELVRASGLEWTIMRPSLIYGPEDAFINMLAANLRLAPAMPVMGDGAYRVQPIHADDVARCFAMALEMPGTAGHCFELCGNERFSFNQLLDEIAAAMGKSAPIKLHAPLGLMKLVIPVMQNLPQFPITMDQLQMLLEENICDCSWKQTFGFEPRDFRQGIRDYLGKRPA